MKKHRLIHITDTHLFIKEDSDLLGMNTLSSLEAVVSSIQSEEAMIDAILVTGDIAQEPSIEAYQHLASALANFHCPVYVLFGNHDDRLFFHQAALPSHFSAPTKVELGPWVLSFLDSQVPGKVHGALTEQSLSDLDATLNEHSEQYALLLMHHQPVPIGAAWLDNIMVSNPEKLFQRIEGKQQVKGILWGHIHQAYEGQQDGHQLMATPSTCIQFLPLSENFALDEDKAPGYRWLDLHPDGRIETGVVRADHFDYELVYDHTGYK